MASPGIFARFRDEIEDGFVLGPVRLAIGLLLGWQSLVMADDLAKLGYFGDMFHVPMIPDALVPSGRVYALTLAVRVVLAALVAIGIWARPALAASAALGFVTFLWDRNQFHHNRYSLFCYAFLLAFTPCDRSWRAHGGDVLVPRRGPFWAVHLAQAQVSIVYLASGGSKLLDSDWRDGLVLGDRITRHANLAIAAGVPKRLVDTLANPDVASAMAKMAIMTELVLCVAIWLPPTRVIALWWGLWFHVAIQATSKVEGFSILALAMYGVFVTPDYRERTLRFDPSRFWGKLAGTIVPWLDWFARIQGRALGARRAAWTLRRHHPARRRARDGRASLRDDHALCPAALPDLGAGRVPFELHEARRHDDERLARHLGDDRLEARPAVGPADHPEARPREERRDVERTHLPLVDVVAGQEREKRRADPPADVLERGGAAFDLDPDRGAVLGELAHHAGARPRRLAIQNERDARHLRERRPLCLRKRVRGGDDEPQSIIGEVLAREAAWRLVSAHDAEVDVAAVNERLAKRAARATDDELHRRRPLLERDEHARHPLGRDRAGARNDDALPRCGDVRS